MNSAHIVATAAFLLLLSQLNNANAGGPYDGEWTGTARSIGGQCRRAVVNLTVEGQVVLGQARFERDAPNINGTVDEQGAVGGTIGFLPPRDNSDGIGSRGPSRPSIANGRLFSGARGSYKPLRSKTRSITAAIRLLRRTDSRICGETAREFDAQLRKWRHVRSGRQRTVGACEDLGTGLRAAAGADRGGGSELL
jgi:hypothetical protein